MTSLLALVGLLIQGTLEASSIEISASAGAAVIRAAYTFSETVDDVTFTAIRLEGQTLTVDAVEAVRPDVSMRGGLYRIAVAGNASGGLRIRYRVSGDIRRIPIFVPDKPTVQGYARPGIRITGVDANRRLEGAFPRMRRDANGDLVASPLHLPGFLILPPRGASVTLNQVADVMVIVVILAATAIWVWIHRRHTPVPR